MGLGVNPAVLAVAYGVLWRPLPYHDASRLVTVAEVNQESGSESGVWFDRLRSGTAASGRCGWPATTRGNAWCAARVRPA